MRGQKSILTKNIWSCHFCLIHCIVIKSIAQWAWVYCVWKCYILFKKTTSTNYTSIGGVVFWAALIHASCASVRVSQPCRPCVSPGCQSPCSCTHNQFIRQCCQQAYYFHGRVSASNAIQASYTCRVELLAVVLHEAQNTLREIYVKITVTFKIMTTKPVGSLQFKGMHYCSRKSHYATTLYGLCVICFPFCVRDRYSC